MIAIIVDHARIPRSTTRQQWRALDRWVRVYRREIAKQTALRLKNLHAWPHSNPAIMRDMLDTIINPPVCIVDRFHDLFAKMP